MSPDLSRPLRPMVTHLALLGTMALYACSPVRDLPARSIQAIHEPEPIEAGVAPDEGPYAPGFDALHYDVHLTLPDTGSYLKGRAEGRFLITTPRTDTLVLDLTGLAVTAVRDGASDLAHRYDEGRLRVGLPATARVGDTLEVTVDYEGTPDDGLILGTNLHGDPTAFADNWPNRARYWFPSIDHPSDKATVRFTVRVDERRRVIANGRLVSSESNETVWAVDRPIPTYTMVVGAAEFAVETVGEACYGGTCTEVTTWLFPEDAHQTASFRRGADMVRYYSELIAPFPYEKLAHVQSSTRFGGMENVGAIFYPEQAIHAGRDIELTVAHETAHQWFGDSVTESDWHHLWLSEGFATYFAALFFEEADGDEAFRRIMNGYRESYLRSGASVEPVVFPGQDNLFELLNANNYQKGAWILHMLRSELGDEAFFDGIRSFYRRHEHGTALTDDLREALEQRAGRSLETFFDLWVFRPGHPRIGVSWTSTDSGADVVVTQQQPADWPTFNFPLELALDTAGGELRRTITVDARRVGVSLDLGRPAVGVAVDPDVRTLVELQSIVRTDED